MEKVYDRIVKEFASNSRDVHTVPTTAREPKWFHVFVEKGMLHVEAAHINQPGCRVKKRSLQEKECDTMLEIYHKRCAGYNVSKEAHESTYSQVYWYGIFAELKL